MCLSFPSLISLSIVCFSRDTFINIFLKKSTLVDLFYLALYITFLLIIAINLPKNVTMYHEEKAVILSFGVIGAWRYCWWMNHVVRSLIYGHIVFPRRRLKANALWDSGWRPKRLIFMMTTFKEFPNTTELVLQSIVDECSIIGVPVKLFVGTGTESDERIIENFFSKQKTAISFEVILVRQEWCLIDQRCAIWTMFIGHLTIMVMALTRSYTFLLFSFLWIAFSRLCISSMLFIHARRIDMSFPFLVYINQFMSTITKIYILFRLPQQRWTNRGDHSLGYEEKIGLKVRGWVVTYLTAFYCLCCLLLILILFRIVSLPTLGDIKTI